jgi:hypothetical protein
LENLQTGTKAIRNAVIASGLQHLLAKNGGKLRKECNKAIGMGILPKRNNKKIN